MPDRIDGEPAEIACRLFEQGFTCSQAVLAAFAARHGLGREEALRLGCAFGGGIARTGGVCGAVSGAGGAALLTHRDGVRARVVRFLAAHAR